MKKKLKALLREPALVIDTVESLVVLLLAFGIGLSGDQQTYIVATAVALLGLLKAFLIKPFAISAVTDFGRTLLCLLAAFGVGLTADQIAVAITALGTVTTLWIRVKVAPQPRRRKKT